MIKWDNMLQDLKSEPTVNPLWLKCSGVTNGRACIPICDSYYDISTCAGSCKLLVEEKNGNITADDLLAQTEANEYRSGETSGPKRNAQSTFKNEK